MWVVVVEAVLVKVVIAMIIKAAPSSVRSEQQLKSENLSDSKRISSRKTLSTIKSMTK